MNGGLKGKWKVEILLHEENGWREQGKNAIRRMTEGEMSKEHRNNEKGNPKKVLKAT